MASFKTYYWLTKPGIIYGNALTAVAGFFYASQGHFYLSLFLGMLVGISLVIASGCVFNNYIDRNIDKQMKRTSQRALATGEIKPLAAIIYATILGIAGFLLLGFFTNAVVIWIGAVGFVDYVVIYGLSKRRWTAGTIIGSISGATPITAGYCAVSGRIDAAALLLFGLLVVWQMPHFYAIAMFRRDDYKAAKIPVLPIVKGAKKTKQQIIVYCVLYIVVCASLTLYGKAGYVFGVSASSIGLWWLWRGLRGFTSSNDSLWARSMFKASLIVLVSTSSLLMIARVLP